MMGTLRLCHPAPIHIARESIRTHSSPVDRVLLSFINLRLRIRRFRRDHARARLVEWLGRRPRFYLVMDLNLLTHSSSPGRPRGQVKCQPIDRNADHASLQFCRAYFPTTLGVWSDAVLVSHTNCCTIIYRFRILVVGKVCIMYHTGRRCDC
jgi:hypothetical protein